MNGWYVVVVVLLKATHRSIDSSLIDAKLEHFDKQDLHCGDMVVFKTCCDTFV